MSSHNCNSSNLTTSNHPHNSESTNVNHTALVQDQPQILDNTVTDHKLADPTQHPNYRPIKSYVLRTSRLTQSQEHAVEDLMPIYGINFPGLDASLNPNEFFEQQQPIVLEIGFGMGVSLVEMAQANPHLNYIGIEVHTPGVGNCLKLLHEKQLKNLRVIQHDAIEILQVLVPESLSGLQLYFPDPWHKARHHKRRIVNANFLNLVITALKPQGFIHMATDWENYAQQMLEVLSQDPRITNTSEDNTYIPRPDHRPLTKFEQRGHRLGHGVWDLYFTKN